MGDIFSAIYDDIDEYLDLCKHFNVEPERGANGPSPYGEHARQLKNRFDRESQGLPLHYEG